MSANSVCRDVRNQFSKSALRMSKFKDVQKRFKDKDISENSLAGLSYVPTHWRSLLISLNRIIELWANLDI